MHGTREKFDKLEIYKNHVLKSQKHWSLLKFVFIYRPATNRPACSGLCQRNGSRLWHVLRRKHHTDDEDKFLAKNFSTTKSAQHKWSFEGDKNNVVVWNASSLTILSATDTICYGLPMHSLKRLKKTTSRGAQQLRASATKNTQKTLLYQQTVYWYKQQYLCLCIEHVSQELWTQLICYTHSVYIRNGGRVHYRHGTVILQIFGALKFR